MKTPKSSRELVTGVFEGELFDRIPIWFMRQAGRYLPEYMEIRNKYNFEERSQNPDLAAEITIQPIDRYDLDAAIIFSDILIPIYGMDIGLEIKPGIGPVIDNPVSNPSEVAKLTKTTSKDDFAYLPESIEKVRKQLPDKALFGFSGAPFTLASYIIEGKSTKDALKTKAFAYKYPEEFSNLLGLLTDIIIDQLGSQLDAGADIIQVFDSWALYLSPEQYQNWSLKPLQRIFNTFSDNPNIYYCRGTKHLLPLAKNIGAKGYSIDFSLSIPQAKQIVGDALVQGNYEPAYLLSTPDIVRKTTQNLLEVADTSTQSNYIFNLASGINKNATVDNVDAMVSTVKKFRRSQHV